MIGHEDATGSMRIATSASARCIRNTTQTTRRSGFPRPGCRLRVFDGALDQFRRS